MNGYIDIGDFIPSAMPLDDLLDTYTQCLDLSRKYVKKTVPNYDGPAGEDKDIIDEVDIDALSQFLAARAELFTIAEVSLDALAEVNLNGQGDSMARRELINKIVAILQEMTAIEEQLSRYLTEHLGKMRDTISQMKKSEPVFKRYSHLGGNQMEPSRITRRE
jgi:hypothetical protein